MLLDYVGELFSTTEKAENSQLVLPVGLMYLSSYLKSKLDGLNVRLIKTHVDYTTDDELLRMIQEFAPDILGIRCLSIDVERLLQTASRLKEEFKQESNLIVLGGPVTNAETARVFNSGYFDYVIVNEGERSFCEVVEAHRERRSVNRDVVGIVHELDNYRGDLIEDLDNLPFPDYSLIDFGKYDNFLNYGYNRARQGVLVTSRGCPYRCTYCHNIMGRKARLRGVDNIVEEIEWLYHQYQIRDFFIVDDIFNIDYDRAMTVFDRLIATGLDLSLYFPNGVRGDILDKPYIDRMVEAGTKYVSFAIESASPRLQKLMRKHVKLDALKEIIHYTCDKGIMVNGFFMFGIPTETEEEAMMTLQYAEELDKLHFPFVFFARYYEGSEMFQQAMEYGFTQDMIHNSVNQLYHDIDNYSTPTLSNEFIRYVKDYFLYRIFFNSKRIEHMLEVEKRYHTSEQTLDIIQSMYNLQMDSVAGFQEYVDALYASKMSRRYARPYGSPVPV